MVVTVERCPKVSVTRSVTVLRGSPVARSAGQSIAAVSTFQATVGWTPVVSCGPPKAPSPSMSHS